VKITLFLELKGKKTLITSFHFAKIKYITGVSDKYLKVLADGISKAYRQLGLML